jgi:hypothetical protein
MTAFTHRLLRRHTALVLAVCVALAGCPAATKPPSTTEPPANLHAVGTPLPAPWESFVQALAAQRTCNAVLSSPAVVARVDPTVSTPVDAIGPLREQVRAVLLDPQVVPHPERVASCVAALPSLPCAEALDTLTPPHCRDVFAGTVVNDDLCTTPYACVSQACSA